MKFNRLTYIVMVLLLISAMGFNVLSSRRSHLDENLRYARVQEAYKNQIRAIDLRLTLLDLVDQEGQRLPFDMYIRAFKKEGQMEVWVKGKSVKRYTHYKTYSFCANSGDLGPKWKQGDLQIPEGLYHISRFNPQSSFHLSMRLNYPNKSDSIRSRARNLGGDIYIHGGCETIGCIPITDARIEELYVLALMAKSDTESEIPVHVFPARLNRANRTYLNGTKAGKYKSVQKFWDNLTPMYHYFERTGMCPQYSINNAGRYVLIE